MKRYYKIGELVNLYNVGRDSIKYYEDLKILNPSRDKNGYRIYDINDICKLNLIRELRNLNIPMKEIKIYLEDRNIESTKNMLEKEISIIHEKIDYLEKQKNNLKNRLRVINNGINERNFGEVEIIHLNKRKAFKVHGNVNNNENIDFLIQEMRKVLENRFYILGNDKIGSIFDKVSLEKGIVNKYKHVIAFLDDDSLDYNTVIPEGEYLTCTYRGSYENNKIYLSKLYDYAETNNLKIVGEPMEIYKVDISETSEEDEFITQLQVLVEMAMIL
ncbi:MerR family transcriptional regulator [Terrisporobacter sp.]|uniref:MerR family transcriptional regulator n=1 Tax=Terrisporobacter sp. TaxID=1965305 RepID=UPI0026369054|nr:MerR family transcriptional regulator [Terrisporobacter sp.]